MSSSTGSNNGPGVSGDPGNAPPLPTNSDPFEFACQCLNIRIEARIPSGSPLASTSAPISSSSNSRLQQVWLGEKAETVRFEAYVTWDQGIFNPHQGSNNEDGAEAGKDRGIGAEEDSLLPSWRTCWICGTRCYRASGKEKIDPALENGWVTIDPSTGISYGQNLEQRDASTEDEPSDYLPFSSLRLQLPSSSSTFGRPPQTNFPTLYPPVTEEPKHSIPPVQDPFFLPPPFIPSHPHLRSLCNDAVVHLHAQHERLEHEVKEYIALKSREMRDLEEKVRVEIEMLWDKYRTGPGLGDVTETGKSTASTETPIRPGVERTRSKTVNGPPLSKARSPSHTLPLSPSEMANNPIVAESVINPPRPAGSSLLSASISANPYAATLPAPIADAVDTSLRQVSKTFGKDADARAVAMSHVFSVLDEAMAGKTPTTSSQNFVETEAEEEENKLRADRDSWIDAEKLAANSQVDGDGGKGVATEGTTPRPSKRDELSEKRKSKGKEKVVKFEEPSNGDAQAEATSVPQSDRLPSPRDEDDYVFDMEFDDHAQSADPDEAVPWTPPQPPRTFSRTRNMVEANLSRTFAADAPSHRSAWKRHLERGTSMFDSMKRTNDIDQDDDVSDDMISQLATSMPVAIVMNQHARRKPTDLPAMERKTSLPDREGVLVPPLRAAMREMGIGNRNALGLSSPATAQNRPTREEQSKKTTRSASVSREREREQVLAKSYQQDPGAVFESLADDDEDDEGSDGGGDGGTLRESKTFVPPHVVIKQEEIKQGPEVGWRSLATSD